MIWLPVGLAHADDPESSTTKVYLGIKPLMELAEKDGSADGIVQGPIADKMSSMTQSHNAVYAHVVMLGDSPKKAGCHDMGIDLTQHNVRFKDGDEQPITVHMKIEFCPAH